MHDVHGQCLLEGGVRVFTPVVDTAERVGLKASIKAKAAAHKAQKAQKKGNLNFNILSKLEFAIWKTLFRRILVDYGDRLPNSHHA